MTASHTYLNQIFYIPKKFDDLDCIQKYMLSHETLNNYQPKNASIQAAETERSELFRPKQKDSLFWGLYVAHHGINEYNMIQNKHKNREMEEKHTILSFIQKNNNMIKDVAKQSEIKMSQVRLKEIQSELLLDKNTSSYVFFVMCVYYKVNAIIQIENIYMHFQTGSQETFLFTKHKNVYEIDLYPISQEKLDHIVTTCLLVPFGQEKPLKGMTGYKVNELEKMADKLQISYENTKKQELYNAILVKLVDLQN